MTGHRAESVARADSARSAITAFLLLGIAILGILLRLDGIGSSLWLDEFGTLWTVEGAFRDVASRAVAFHGQTPFYYAFAWLAIQPFGESEVALRLPSLIFGLAAWWTIGAGAWLLFGRTAGFSAIVLAAFDPTLIHASADARPYSLALFMLALAVVGFIRSGLTGDRLARAIWVSAGAATMWAHYVFYPFVVGIVLAYLVVPQFQRRYESRLFRRDVLIHLALVALTVPQLIQLATRRDALDWVSTGYTGDGLILMTLPYWIPLLLGALAVRMKDESTRIPYRALWTGLLVGTLAYVALKGLGTNLLHWRYMQGAIVCLLLLASGGVAVLSRLRASVSLLVTVMLLATLLLLIQRSSGTFTQAGFEGWRQATEALEGEIRGDTLVPVLYRSGFIEEDQLPLGAPVPATRAPLRSPGRPAPHWNIIPLTATWEIPGREAYFNEQVLPRLDASERFHMLVRFGGYASLMIEWLENMRPNTFTTKRRDFGQVTLVTFERLPAPSS